MEKKEARVTEVRMAIAIPEPPGVDGIRSQMYEIWGWMPEEVSLGESARRLGGWEECQEERKEGGQ